MKRWPAVPGDAGRAMARMPAPMVRARRNEEVRGWDMD
jgi:hypothetical protein